MSFFKDLKEEVMNEKEDLTSEETMVDTFIEEDEFASFDLSEEEAQALEEELLAKMELEETLLAEEEEEEAEPASEEKAEEHIPITEESAPIAEEKQEETEETISFVQPEGVDSGKTTVITKGTVINGSIVSDGSLEVFGTVSGDINCLGKLTISGTVNGKSSAAEVFINTNRLDGGITSKGSVKISVGTVVIGDISAASCVIAGAVKGNLDVNGPVIIDSTAVVKGDIKAKGIQVNNGAVIDGFCALSYASVDIDSFFGEEE